MFNYKLIGKYIFLSLFFAFLIGLIFGVLQWFASFKENSFFQVDNKNKNYFFAGFHQAVNDIQAMDSLSFSGHLFPLRNWQIEPLMIQAKAGISIEVGINPERVLLAKEEHQRLPIASLTKLMTALVVLQNYDLEKKIMISPQTMTQLGEQGQLSVGQILSVKDLLYITLIESSNRAAFALAEVLGSQNFVDLMNITAEKIGLKNTYFKEAAGLSPDSFSTAYDLAKLTEYLFFHYPLFREIISIKNYNLYVNGVFHHKLVNTNELLGQNDIIGGKTGFTDIAKGCFVVIQKSRIPGRYIISVLLGSHDRVGEIKNIINWIQKAYTW